MKPPVTPPGPHTDDADYNRAYAPYTEWVPTATMMLFREYAWSRTRSRYSSEQWDALLADVAQNGIRDPIIMLYNPYNAAALIGEGNHRLGIALELRMPYVPVRVRRNRGLTPGCKRTNLSDFAPCVVPGGRIWPEDVYVPSDMPPSLVLPPSLFTIG